MRRRHRRPVYVTIICWLLMISNLISLMGVGLVVDTPVLQAVMKQSSLPVWAQYAHLFGSLIASTFCGLFMLQGANWARWTYLGVVLVNQVLNSLTTFAKEYFWISLAGSILCTSLLFLPRANAFFRRRGRTEGLS